MEALENSKDNNGQYLYPSLQGEVKTLKGRPILVTDYQPSSTILFGDLSYYYIGDRQQVTMDVTTEAGNTWEKYQVGLRLIERVDGELALSQAIVSITGTNIH
jgi:HK97 family phage major capsid protein